MRRTFDQNIDRFELYVLRNIFTVPDGLPAPLPVEEDRAETRDLTAEHGAAALSDVVATEAQLAAVRERVVALHARVAEVRIQLRAANELLDQLGVENSPLCVHRLVDSVGLCGS